MWMPYSCGFPDVRKPAQFRLALFTFSTSQGMQALFWLPLLWALYFLLGALPQKKLSGACCPHGRIIVMPFSFKTLMVDFPLKPALPHAAPTCSFSPATFRHQWSLTPARGSHAVSPVNWLGRKGHFPQWWVGWAAVVWQLSSRKDSSNSIPPIHFPSLWHSRCGRII